MDSRWNSAAERQAFRQGAERAKLGLSRTPLHVQRDYSYNQRAAFRDGYDTTIALIHGKFANASRKKGSRARCSPGKIAPDTRADLPFDQTGD